MTTPVVTKIVAPPWVKRWLWALTLVLAVGLAAAAYFIWSLTGHVKTLSAWDTKMHRWAAHYYFCDSAHRDESKCAQWSDHISPPPPPPLY
jgi:hypothetical protein